MHQTISGVILTGGAGYIGYHTVVQLLILGLPFVIYISIESY